MKNQHSPKLLDSSPLALKYVGSQRTRKAVVNQIISFAGGEKDDSAERVLSVTKSLLTLKDLTVSVTLIKVSMGDVDDG